MMDVAPGMDYCYEDMFKEITHKLYGNVEAMQQQAGQSVIAGVFNGVINEAIVVNGKMADFVDTFKQQQPSPPQQESGTVIVDAAYIQDQFQAETAAATAALVAGDVGGADEATQTSEAFEASQAASQQEEEEASPDGEGEIDPTAPDTWFMTDEGLEWTDSKIASYNPKQRLFRCIDCECCGFLARVAEHWLGTHANLRVFQCPHCPYASAWARCVRMHLARQHNASEQNSLWTENPVLGEVTKYLTRLRERVETGPLVVVSEEDLTPEDHQQMEMEQHEMRLHEQRQVHERALREQQIRELQLQEQHLREQQLHEQQLREQQLHEQQLQQQLQQQAEAAAGRSPSSEEYAAALSAAESAISSNAMTQTSLSEAVEGQPQVQAQPVRSQVRAGSSRPSTSKGGKGPRRVNKAIAVAAAVAAAAARGEELDPATAGASVKRYNCTSCPYQTDRRDLYTRHEAIHLAEKPFHCYACQKQFNRADHVKKHFLRMHRDQPYDLNRIRRASSHSSAVHSSSVHAASKPPSPDTGSSLGSSHVTTPTPTGNGSMAFFTTKYAAAGGEDVNGLATTSTQSAEELQQLELEQQQLEQQQLELEQQQLELEQQQLEQQQLQQHELQLQQQEIQLQQQIILQTQVSRP